MNREWLTDVGPILQSNIPNKILTLSNQLLLLGNIVYLIPRNTLTDNYTIPLGINKSKWDTRPSHLHDIGCRYHQVIVVNLPLDCIYTYINTYKDKQVCSDIPKEYLKVVDVGFNECNKLLRQGMLATQTIPYWVANLYRTGVELNFNWLLTGKDNINLDNLYTNILYT